MGKQDDLMVIRTGYDIKHISEAISRSIHAMHSLRQCKQLSEVDKDSFAEASDFLKSALSLVVRATKAGLRPGTKLTCGPKRRELSYGKYSFARYAGTEFRTWPTHQVRAHYTAVTRIIRLRPIPPDMDAVTMEEAKARRRHLAIELLLRKEKFVTRTPAGRPQALDARSPP